MVVSGFLVEVERADLGELIKKYPEAFPREHGSASGLRFNSWVAGKNDASRISSKTYK
jgi:hypothetical protein